MKLTRKNLFTKINTILQKVAKAYKLRKCLFGLIATTLFLHLTMADNILDLVLFRLEPKIQYHIKVSSFPEGQLFVTTGLNIPPGKQIILRPASSIIFTRLSNGGFYITAVRRSHHTMDVSFRRSEIWAINNENESWHLNYKSKDEDGQEINIVDAVLAESTGYNNPVSLGTIRRLSAVNSAKGPKVCWVDPEQKPQPKYYRAEFDKNGTIVDVKCKIGGIGAIKYPVQVPPPPSSTTTTSTTGSGGSSSSSGGGGAANTSSPPPSKFPGQKPGDVEMEDIHEQKTD